MKLLPLFVIFFSFTALAGPQPIILKGPQARAVMEALASSPEIKVNGLTKTFDKVNFKAEKIVCSFSHSLLPDDWMSQVVCSQGSLKLNNPLALAIAIKDFANVDATTGTVTLSLESVACQLDFKNLRKGVLRNEEAYSCLLMLSPKS